MPDLSNTRTAARQLIIYLCIWVLSVSSPLAQQAVENPLLGKDVTAIASVYGASSEYDIMRNGKRIGTHVLSFSVSDGELEVSVDSSIKVRILGFTVYSLTYRATEIWLGNRLQLATAETVENGSANTVNFKSEGADSESVFASNHWHPGVLAKSRVFNTLTGETENVVVSIVGRESIEIGDRQVSGIRYRYAYEQPVDTWYGSDGRWLRLQFSAEDGSTINYVKTSL